MGDEVPSATWIEALERHAALIEARPGSLRARAQLLCEAGVVAWCAGVPTSLALMNVGFVTALVGALLARAPLARMPGFALGCAQAAWVAISALATIALGRDPHPTGGLAVAYVWLAVPLAPIALRRPRARRAAIACGGIAAAAAAALAVAQFAVGWDPALPPWRLTPRGLRHVRASAFFGGGLTLGGVMAAWAILAAAGGAVTATARRWRVLGGLSAAIALIVSTSRMAWISAAVGFAARFACARRRAAAIAVLVVAPLVAAGLLMVFKPDALRALAGGNDGRLIIWRTSVTLIAETPLIGTGGAHGFKARYEPRWQELYGARDDLFVREPSVAHAHASVLSLAVEYGIPAALIHLAWWASLALAAWRVRARQREAAALALATIAAALAAGCFNDVATQAQYGYAYAAALGCAFAALAAARPSGQ